MSDSVTVYSLEEGQSALVLSADCCSCSVRTAFTSNGLTVEDSAILVTTLAVLIDGDPEFRRFLVEKSHEIMEGTYLPLTFREDCH